MKYLTVAGMVAVALAGCAARSTRDNPSFAVGMDQAVSGTNLMAEKANAALDNVCESYQTADAAFQLIKFVSGERILQSVIDAESDAVRFLANLCANRPQDANDALKAAQQAYATVVSIRKRLEN